MPVTKSQSGKYVITHELNRLEDLRRLQTSLLDVVSAACSSDDKENLEFGMDIYELTEIIKSTLLDESQLRELDKLLIAEDSKGVMKKTA